MSYVCFIETRKNQRIFLFVKTANVTVRILLGFPFFCIRRRKGTSSGVHTMESIHTLYIHYTYIVCLKHKSVFQSIHSITNGNKNGSNWVFLSISPASWGSLLLSSTGLCLYIYVCVSLSFDQICFYMWVCVYVCIYVSSWLFTSCHLTHLVFLCYLVVKIFHFYPKMRGSWWSDLYVIDQVQMDNELRWWWWWCVWFFKDEILMKWLLF